jgi:hypothetical protein
MDAETRDALLELARYNRKSLSVVGSLVVMLECQQRQIINLTQFATAVAQQMSGEQREALPPLPNEEELHRQAADIDELKRLFGLEPGEPKRS